MQHSFFDSLKQLPEDPIMHLPIIFAEDQNPNKVNLGIGSYKNAEGKPVVLSAVREAEKQIFEKKLNKEYPPIEGLPEFNALVLELIFGKQLLANFEGKIFGMQTAGGTGALRIGGEFLSWNYTKNIYLPDPTWANHHLIFPYAHMQPSFYPYYDAASHGLDFDKLCDSIQKMKPHSAILLHGSCHNPTGMDPSREQWQILSKVIKKQKLFPFFDLAYQGFGDGIEEDAYAIRLFVEEGHEMLVASSYAKNFGLYGERVGQLAFVGKNVQVVQSVRSHLKQVARSCYSVPPLHGGRIVAAILGEAPLKAQWEQELAAMRMRIAEMRHTLVVLLQTHSGKSLEYLEQQKGMFSYTDLNAEQVSRLRKEYGVHLAGNGRANMAGLNDKNIQYVARSIAAVL